MTLHPKVPADLMLAPVAIAIDDNLERLRNKKASDEIETELQLALNQPPATDTREERAARILELALRNVDLHGWSANVAEDFSRIHLRGGSVSIDLGLSATITAFVHAGRGS
jgi:hypothetical protein